MHSDQHLRGTSTEPGQANSRPWKQVRVCMHLYMCVCVAGVQWEMWGSVLMNAWYPLWRGHAKTTSLGLLTLHFSF